MQQTSTLVNDLHANTPNALCCTYYIGNVIYHKFSHRDVSYGSVGKPLALCKNFYSFPIESNPRIAAIQICETVEMIHVFPHMDVMCVIFTVCFTEKSLHFIGKHKKETYIQNNT